jgi:DTW domain
MISNPQLPIKVDIIKHAKEIDGKSTSAHAAVLAPDDVAIYTFPCIPDYDQTKEKVMISAISKAFFGSFYNINFLLQIVLVFPGKDAISIDEFISQQTAVSPGSSKRPHPSDPLKPIDRAIFIDSTWNQCKGIFKDSRLKSMFSSQQMRNFQK